MLRLLRSLYPLLLLLSVLPARAGAPMDYRPDPRSVQRYGPAYRYPQAGWIVLHVEGEPYERGFQQGKLLAPEIAANVRCFAETQAPDAPAEGWRLTRTLTNALFVRRYDKEYLEEMKGIADGAAAAGAKFEERPVDLVDVVALNAWPEIGTLDSALEALPTGLEGLKTARPGAKLPPLPKEEHCSAFAAVGPATADGKIVFGHITMFGLYPSNFFNVWLDVKPSKGHRVLMQTYPGGIQSGLDYYLNDAGLIVTETTIRQTKFEPQGLALASRIRKALQYADNIDGLVAILRDGNNGLYTNEWLMADIKTNEIAMFELGTHKDKLYRSSKNEWYGGTEGFYWGCNNTKDLDVRLETLASTDGRPANVVFHPSDRDKLWQRLYREHRGKIDADFGRLAFTTAPIAAYHSLDAKVTTTALAGELKTWALFGPPLGRTWQPSPEERKNYPEIRPLYSNPWTILHVNPPAPAEANAIVAVDLGKRLQNWDDAGGGRRRRGGSGGSDGEGFVPTVPAWHGTLLPKTDADVWLAAAFADYEHYVSQETALHKRAKDGKLAPADQDRLALTLFAPRSSYLAATRTAEDKALADVRSLPDRDEWYHIAAGKGVLLLHELRRTLGDATFATAMDSFGQAHAGKEVTTAEFKAHLEKAAGKKLDDFFAIWLTKPGLPTITLGEVAVSRQGNAFTVAGELRREPQAPATSVEVLVRTRGADVSKTVHLDGPVTRFTLETSEAPRRLVVDPHARAVHASGPVFSTQSFSADLEHTLIVYGTADEVPTNREAAEALQRAILQRGSNVLVAIRSDKEVTEAELKGNHLLLIGRPDTNAVVARFRDALPIRFGSRSFVVGEDVYANPDSGVIAAGENPLDRKRSIVVLAGLEGGTTLRSAPLLERRGAAEVIVLPASGETKTLVLPARDLVRELAAK